MQTKFDLAGIFGKRPEMPSALQTAKGTVNQADMHRIGENLVVFGGK